MKQFDTLWTKLQPLLPRLSTEEQETITAAFDRTGKAVSGLESKYQHAIKERTSVHALLTKSSDDLTRRYQTLFENSGTAMAVIESDGIISLTNSLFLKLLGYRREDIENRKNFFSIFTENFRYQVQNYHRRRKDGEGNVPDRYEAQVITDKGRVLDVIIMIGFFPGSGQSVASIINITDRKLIEDELRLFKTSAERAFDEVFWLDFEGNMLYVNDAACRNTGYSREELTSMKVFALDPDFDPDLWQGFIKNLRKEKTLLFETRHKRKDGSIMDIEIVTNYVTKGEQEFSFAYVRDITKRKQAEAELAESREYLSKIFSSIQAGIMVIDAKNHEIINVNAAAARMIGTTEREIIGKVCHKFICPAEAGNCPITDLHQTVNNAERVLITADGRRIPIIKDVIRTTLHGRECLLETFIDNTDRKKLEDELRLLKISVDRGYDEVFWMDMDANMLYVNEAASRTTGYSPEELYAMKIYELDPDFTPDLWEKSIADLRKNKKQFFTTRHKRKDGKILNVEISSVYVTKGEEEYAFCFVHDITESKRAQDELAAAHERLVATDQELRLNYENLSTVEKKLRDSEAWMREFTEMLPQFIYEIDTTGKLLFVNQYAADVFGISREMIDRGLNMKDFLIPQDWEIAQKNLIRVAGGDKTSNYTYHLRRRDGDLMPVNIYTVPVLRDGILKGFRGIIVDITEYLRAQEALQKSETRFRELAELLPQIVFELDERLNFTFFNWNIIEMTGLAYDELSKEGAGIIPLLRESDRKHVEQFFARLMKESSSGHIECVIVTQQGKEIPAIIYASPIISENRIAGIRGVIVDIAEQKVLESALRDSETRFRELAELIPQFIFETDTNYRFTYYNFSAMAVTGYSLDDFERGIDAFSLVDIADRPILREAFQKILGGGGISPLQFPLKTKEGELLPVILYASPIVRENAYAGIRGIIVDIADQKRLEKALATTNQKLNLMNSLTRHDVLNNITGLLGLVDMLGELTSDSNALVLIQEIRGLIITIKDQVVFTRDYQSVGVKAPQWQNLCQDITYAMSTIGLDRVLIRMPETNAEIYADPFFGRVFYNLIDNSLRHGGSVRTITIETGTEKDGSLKILYRDDGIGVHPDEKELIFKQGFGKNTGFGLFIIREILDITGLTIKENGTFRKGALFEITVPKESWRPLSGTECREPESL